MNVNADKILSLTAQFWFLVAVLGQWIFVVYIACFYGLSVLNGDMAAWNQVLPNGHIAGDTIGNLAVAIHILIAIIIIGGGPLQLIPHIRSYAPRFHHWNGRIYITCVFITSIVGLYMVLTRGTVGGLAQHVGISLDAVLIMTFAGLALRYAMMGNIKIHRRWALRLFMVVNGVWFYRVGLMFWVFINGGPVGIDFETFTGPFLVFLSFGCYLLPLSVLEVYLRVKDHSGKPGKLIFSVALLILTIAMATGIFITTVGMWLPRI